MSFGEGNLHERVEDLESLVRSLFNTMNTLRVNGHAPTGRQLDHYEQRMRALGIEVNGCE